MIGIRGGKQPAVRAGRPPTDGGTRWPAYAAAGCALAYAAVSVYWGCGGTAGLDTVGAEAVRLSRAGDPVAYAALWIATVLKVVGALLALAMVRSWGRRFPRRLLLVTGALCAVGLVGYGGLLVAVELLVVSGVIAAPADMDWRGFHGHLYLWDPWFVVWGVLLGLATVAFARHGQDGSGQDRSGQDRSGQDRHGQDGSGGLRPRWVRPGGRR